MRTDVLIVGAGPTGLALAVQLARYGIEFIILDRETGTTPYSKAIGVQARTLEIYEQIGIAGEIIEQGTVAHRARLIEGGKVRGEIKFDEFGKGLSPYPYVLLVEQGKHEATLYEHLRAAGRDVRWNTEFESFTQDESDVTARIRNADGGEETITAKFIVGCDGAKSRVRRNAGLTFEGSTMERLFYVADVEIDWDHPHDSLLISLAQNTITAFFPLKGSERNFRIVGTFPEGFEKEPADIIYEEVEAQLVSDTAMKLDVTRVNWFSVYKVHSRVVNKFSVGRCFLAGDSAHIHTPAGAQGMNTGIQDGYNLAWKLAFVLNGKASLELLNTYNAERLGNAKKLIETTDRFFDLAASPNAFVSFVRTQVFPHMANFALNLKSVRRFVFPLISQIGISYPNSPLSLGDGWFAVRPGDRMPYFFADGQSIYERLNEPRFHLIAFSDGKAEFGGLAGELSEFGEIMDVHAVPLYPEIAETFGTGEPFCVVLRPDNYIGLITSDVSAERIREYFRTILS